VFLFGFFCGLFLGVLLQVLWVLLSFCGLVLVVSMYTFCVFRGALHFL
jgi:hypothetical protein